MLSAERPFPHVHIGSARTRRCIVVARKILSRLLTKANAAVRRGQVVFVTRSAQRRLTAQRHRPNSAWHNAGRNARSREPIKLIQGASQVALQPTALAICTRHVNLWNSSLSIISATMARHLQQTAVAHYLT